MAAKSKAKKKELDVTPRFKKLNGTPVVIMPVANGLTVTAMRAYVHGAIAASLVGHAAQVEDMLHQVERWQAGHHTQVKMPKNPDPKNPVGVTPDPEWAKGTDEV